MNLRLLAQKWDELSPSTQFAVSVLRTANKEEYKWIKLMKFYSPDLPATMKSFFLFETYFLYVWDRN